MYYFLFCLFFLIFFNKTQTIKVLANAHLLLVVCNRVRGQNPSFSVFPPISCNLIDFSSHGEYQSSEGYDPTYCMILTHSFTLDFVNSNPNLPSFLFLIFSELDFQVSSERKSSPTLILVDNSFCISPNFFLTLFSFSNCNLCRKRASRFGSLSKRI